MNTVLTSITIKKNRDLISIIQPPDAVIPQESTGNLNFTSSQNPATGRSTNQGMNS